MISKKVGIISLFAVTALAGAAIGAGFIVHGQTGTQAAPAVSPSVSGLAKDFMKHHAPLGGDGTITAINGATITMTEEANEGGATYTINTSGATLTKGGAAAQLSDFKVGEKIFVQGKVDGANVSATSISLGFPGGHRFEKETGNEKDDMNGAKNTGGKVSDGDGETQDDTQTQSQ